MVRRITTSSRPIHRSIFLRSGTEIDSREFSDLATNFEEAQAFREATLLCIRRYLEIEYKVEGQEFQIRQPPSRRSILEYFAPVGRAMINHCVPGRYLVHVCGLRPVL